MKKIEILAATKLEDAIYELRRESKRIGQKCYADFNCKTIYSTDTVNDAYSRVVGKSKEDFDNDMNEQREEYKRKEEQHRVKIPELTKHWIEEGHKHISPEYWTLWDKCVPIRLGDLYQGMELDCTMKLVKILNISDNIEDTYQSAKEEIESQGHSGMSFGLVKSMIKSFHTNGNLFFEKLSS